MESKKVLAIGMGMFLMLSVCIGISTIHLQMVQGDPVFRQIQGIVDPNSTTGVRAYDLVQNGFVYYYIQNRTNEGNGTDPMETNPAPPPVVDFYDPPISSGINDWQVGDECILVVDREYGSYGTDHAGYVAFMNVTLVAIGGVQFAPTTELKKIPVPTMVSNGTGWIEISWDALDDPNGLIAGYKVYRSTTNGTILGDDDWTLVGGTVNAPLTVTNYNDTSVVGGTTYYYSIKVVFTGYKNNDPLQVENYQNQIFGEGSGEMSSEVSIYTVNYFTLTTGSFPNGPELTTEFLDVGETIQIWASGYNNSVVPNPYVSPVVVDWSQSPSLGWFSTTNGDNTIFTAGYYQGGTTVITGENLAMTPTTDTGDVTVNPPKVDYILLTDSANGTEISDMPWNTGAPLDIFASGYNNTANTYVGLFEVDWSETAIPPLGNFVPIKGTSTVFTGTSSGATTITGENLTAGVVDTFTLNLVGIDFIELTDAPNGNILNIVDLAIGENITVYASGYSSTVGYLNLVDVDWTLMPIGALGYIDNIMGTSTTFFANFTAGGLDLNGTDPTKPSLTDEITVNILEPTLDYILLTNTEDGTPYNLATQTLNINSFMDIFASGYNNTGPTYIGLIDVDWTESAGLGAFDPPSEKGNQTRFTAGGTTGATTIQGENATLVVSDSFVLNIENLTVDYINLTDAPNGVKITALSLDVGETVTLYASGYSSLTTPNTYLGPVEVDWSDSPVLGDFSVDLGTSTVFTAGLVGGTTTITGENSSMTPTVSDSFELTINPPTVDYIIIVDTSGTGTEVIANQTVDVGVTITGYAASFNNTALYIGDVQVTWSVTNEDDATASTEPLLDSITSDFYSGNHAGTATWTADDGDGHTDVVVFTINPPVFDYIQIETETGGAGEEVTTAEFRIGESDQYYCAGYNNSVGYIEDKSAAWSIDVVIGTFDPTPGTFTLFTATTAGEGIITATYDSLTDSTGTISVYPGPPTAPTGLQVSQVASGEALYLTWTANPESYVIGYNIWRSPTNVSGTFTEIASYVSDTSYTDTGLTNGNPYYYHIIAVGDFPAPNASVPSEAANNIADADTDGDEIFNLQDDDDDGDGLTDLEEADLGTDPLDTDTDDDGHNDLEDEYPLDPNKWKKEEDEFPVLLVLIPIIIIIIILILLMLLLKKRKPAEIPAVPEEERELPPPPGAPVEEEEGMLPEEEELPPEEEAPPEGEEELPEEETLPPEEEIPESEKETPP
jgi:hypothetical protein